MGFGFWVLGFGFRVFLRSHGGLQLADREMLARRQLDSGAHAWQLFTRNPELVLEIQSQEEPGHVPVCFSLRAHRDAWQHLAKFGSK